MPRIFILIIAILSANLAFAEGVPASKEEITLSFAPVAKRVVPAVVNIFTRHVEKVQMSPLLADPLFQQFFGAQGFGGMPRERVINSLGSGVIIGKDGTIVTSYHVVKGSDQINIVLSDKREFKGIVEKVDERSDLAILKVDTKGAQLPALALRDSDTLEVGDLVLAVGNPFGVGQTVTSGIISALARSALDISDYQFFIQTDAAINPGNSGGALVDMQGRLIGINTAIYTHSGGYQGIGFAIPANMVKAVLNGQANKAGNIIRPWFGVSVQPVNTEVAEAQGLSGIKGVLVQTVAEKSPAEKVGIKAGDIIISVAGSEVDDPQSLNFRIATVGIGTPVEIALWRGGKQENVSVVFDQPPTGNSLEKEIILKGRHPLNGVMVVTLTPEMAEEYKIRLSRSAVIVLKGNEATEMGINLQKGDIIIAVNGREIQTTEELQKILSMPSNGFRMNIIRNGMEITMAVQN